MCGSVGKAVPSGIRGPRFGTSHKEFFIEHFILPLTVELFIEHFILPLCR